MCFFTSTFYQSLFLLKSIIVIGSIQLELGLVLSGHYCLNSDAELPFNAELPSDAKRLASSRRQCIPTAGLLRLKLN